MTTLLVYASKHGCTEKCATILAEKLSGDVNVCNLEKDAISALESYDTIIIGGSIYAGKVQKAVQDFCAENLELLQKKKIGLFLCCGDPERVESQMKDAFPEPLYSHAVAVEHFGHIYDFGRMNFFERTAIKMIAKVRESEENILTENLERFAATMV